MTVEPAVRFRRGIAFHQYARPTAKENKEDISSQVKDGGFLITEVVDNIENFPLLAEVASLMRLHSLLW